MRRSGLLTAALLALGLAGCGTAEQRPSTAASSTSSSVVSTTASSTSSSTPPPTASSTTSGPAAPATAGHACGRLAVTYAGTEGATGHLEVTLTARNTSSTLCVIRGYPAARLLDAGGRPLPLRVARGHGFFPDTLPAPQSVALAPGGRARIGLSFVTNNEYAGAHTCRTARAIDVALPGAGARWTQVSLRRAPRLQPCGARLVVSPVHA